MLLRDKVKNLKRKFKKISKYKFAYNKPSELKQKSCEIICWYLLQEPTLGLSIKSFRYKSAIPRTAKQWAKWHKDTGYQTYIEKIIPASNVKWGTSYRYVDFILFHF